MSLNLNLAYIGTFFPTFVSNCGKNLEKLEVLKVRSLKPKSLFQLVESKSIRPILDFANWLRIHEAAD
jgi:hypothetical protein